MKQLVLPAAAALKQFGLIVDEVLLNATANPGRGWWATYAARFEAHGRARTLMATVAGAVVEYGPWPRDDAEFMQQHMTDQGLHPKAIKLRKWIADLPDCTGYGRCVHCGRTHPRPITPIAA